MAEVRKFSDEAIQRAIDKKLATLPPETKGAVVAHADLDGIALSVYGRVGEQFSYVGTVQRDWKGFMKAEVDVRFTF
jgi:hypothetical protein